MIFSLVGDQIRYQAPPGVLSDADREYLRLRREEVKAYLRAWDCSIRSQITPYAGAPEPSFIQELWWRWYIKAQRQVPTELVSLVKETGADADHLARAMVEVVRDHQVLRSSFSKWGDKLVVATNPIEDFSVERVNLDDASGPDDGQVAARFREAIVEFLGRELRIDATWLVRAAVIQLKGGPSVAVFLFHHMVVDGTSISLLGDELMRRVEGARPRELAPSLITFADHSAWERAWFAGDTARALTNYWRNWLAAIPPLTSPNGTALNWEVGRKVLIDIRVDSVMLSKLHLSAKQYRTSMLVIIIAAYAVALSLWSQQKRFVVRSVMDGRDTLELAAVVGPLIRSNAFEVDFTATASLSQFLAELWADYDRAKRLAIPSHPAGTGAGFEEFHYRIAAAINYQYRNSPAPVATVSSNSSSASLGAAGVYDIPFPTIYLQVWEGSSEMVCRFQINGNLVAEPEQKALAAAFQRALGMLADLERDMFANFDNGPWT